MVDGQRAGEASRRKLFTSKPSIMGGFCLGRRSTTAPAGIRADVVAPHSVALVGGPCGGKTSVIPALRVRL
jgi:hypothetical protein